MARFKHGDVNDLDKILKANAEKYPKGILVVTDGVFSMDGDIAKLPEILAVVRKYDAILLIDEAHATGVIGEKGAGTLSHYGITERDKIIVTGTLSKAVGTVGGYITASQDIIKSPSFFKANERACFDGVEFHYLQVFRDNCIVAIVPCFSYCIDILNITSSPGIRRRLVWIRKIYPSFLKLRAFVTGSYAATCEHFIEYLPILKSNEIKEVSEIIGDEIKKRCNETKSAFVFIKDVRERAIADVRRVLTNDFRFFVSFPATAIPILKDIPYPEGLKKKE